MHPIKTLAQRTVIGYNREYYLNGKFIGYEFLNTPDRDTLGYYGQQRHTANTKITIGKKSIPKGAIYKTMLIPLEV